MSKTETRLYFDGSLWCNLDAALRSVDALFRRAAHDLGLTVLEMYALRALYGRDGLHASDLARAVGRAATSFTPILDKLQDKGLVERARDLSDRRAIRIYLTSAGWAQRDAVMAAFCDLDADIAQRFSAEDMAAFRRVLSGLQRLNTESGDGDAAQDAVQDAGV